MILPLAKPTPFIQARNKALPEQEKTQLQPNQESIEIHKKARSLTINKQMIYRFHILKTHQASIYNDHATVPEVIHQNRK